MIILLTSVLLIILLSRVTEEVVKIPFALALIIFSYLLRLTFPEIFISLGANFDEILHLMLPLILLPDLLGLTVEEVRRHVWVFLYLAVIAVAASIGIATGITPYLLPDYGFTAGMLIALFAMLMATDAITVSSLFSRFTLPSKLKIYAEGESLFNDVTALIIFYFIALPLLTGGDVTLAGINIVVFEVLTYSVVVGLVACGLGYFALKMIKNPVEQFIIIYLVAILSEL
ncbi:MAG: cation:proton antiporter [Candidatus Sedimenticola sp. (ex Thyasira tokunagai)]